MDPKRHEEKQGQDNYRLRYIDFTSDILPLPLNALQCKKQILPLLRLYTGSFNPCLIPKYRLAYL